MLDTTVRTSPAEGRRNKNSGRHIAIYQYACTVPHWFVRLLFTLCSWGAIGCRIGGCHSCVDEGSSLLGCDTIFITVVNFQLDAQNCYLFIYTFIKILHMFRALPCSSSGGLRRNCIYAASGIVTVCRWLSCAPVKKEQVTVLCTG